MLRVEQVKNCALGFSSDGKPKVMIEMEYEPMCSKNRCKTKDGRFYQWPVVQWMEALTWMMNALVKGQGLPYKPPIHLKIEGVYSGKGRKPDCQNFVDVIADCVKGGIEVDDCNFIVETIPFESGEDPKLIITVTGG